MTLLKVLIPLDGSKLAEASLSYVSSLRALDEVELTLLSVVNELEEVQMLDIQEAHERERGVLTGYLRDVATGMAKHLGLHPHSRVSYGAPADQIIAAARAG